MSSVEEIEAAIEALPPEDYRRVARWLLERNQSMWDRQLDGDNASGKLDFLFDEADAEAKAGRVRGGWQSEIVASQAKKAKMPLALSRINN